MQLKNDKSPGSDGVISSSYKWFANKLAPFLFEVLDKEYLPTTMTQGSTILIPKPNKHTLLLDNWLPICLLNNDSKIFALLSAKRLKMMLDSIIEETVGLHDKKTFSKHYQTRPGHSRLLRIHWW